MKKYIILLGLIFLFSCGYFEAPKKREKPFVIIDKEPNSTSCWDNPESEGRYCRYIYQDAGGSRMSFCEDKDAYSIGDTIW